MARRPLWRPRWLRASLGDRAAVVLGLVLLGLFASLNENTPGEATHSFDDVAVGLLAAAGALLVVSRRFPAAVAAALVALSMVWYSRYTSRLIDLPTIMGFYVLGTTGDRRRQLLVGGPTVLLLLLGTAGEASDVEVAIEGVGWIAAAILAGELVRSRRLLLDGYAERAARAEAERDAEAERRVAGERLRIARDLHDVLAHTVSLMTVQAGVAADAVERSGDRDTVRSALTTLRSVGKEAMAEVRATVAVLRDAGTEGGAGPTGPDTAPAPDLDRVPELVEAARRQGLDVELTVDTGEVEPESLVGLTAYRVVQESLTNAVRHAGASRVAVRIHGDPAGRLVVEVVDDGRSETRPDPPVRAVLGAAEAVDAEAAPAVAAALAPAVREGEAASRPGFGLRGMGERVEAVGGTLSYGPMPVRGWAVRARMPARWVGGDAAAPGDAGTGGTGGTDDAGESEEGRS